MGGMNDALIEIADRLGLEDVNSPEACAEVELHVDSGVADVAKWCATRRLARRRDEVGFRCAVPAQFQRFTILEVCNFQPGAQGAYASAMVVCTGALGGGYSAHRLYRVDDTPGTYWLVEEGSYGLPTRARANEVARSRGQGFDVLADQG